MRNIFLKLKQESADLLEQSSGVRSEKAQTADEQMRRQKTLLEGKVGIDAETGQFGLGKAPRDLKPVTRIEISKEKEKEIAAMQEWEDYSEQNYEEIQQMEEQAMIQKMQKTSKQKGEKREKVDKNTAFLEYKQTDFVHQTENTILQIRKQITS